MADERFVTYKRGDDDTPPPTLTARFYKATEAITDMNGNPTGEYRDFIKIRYRIDSMTVEDRPIVKTEYLLGTDRVTVIGDDIRFPAEWAAFQSRKEGEPVIDVNHLKLSDWLTHEGAAKAFSFYNILTVEDLAKADIAEIKIEGVEKYAEAAKKYLEDRDLKEQNTSLRRELESLRKKTQKNEG